MKKEIKKLEKAMADIQAKIDELKKEERFEVGKWYKARKKDSKSLAFLVRVERDEFLYGYGFDFRGYWVNDDNYWEHSEDNFTEATKEEVEEALIKEAKRRGFKEGVRFVHSEVWSIKGSRAIHGDKFLWDGEDLCIDGWSIFSKGFWGKIIEDKVEINGYEMKQDGDIVSFGCAKFHKNWFTIAHELLETEFQTWDNNRKLKSITLDSGVELTLEDLKKIVDNLK